MTRRQRTSLFAVVAVLVGALLTGCSFGGASQTAPGGPADSPSRSLAMVEEAVAEIPGAQFTAARAWDGTTAYVTATLTATDAFAGDPADLVDYALGQLASQDEIDRGRFVRFTFESPGQAPETTLTLLASLDIDAEQYAGGSSLELTSADLDQRYGTWPAAIPELPATLGDAG